MSTDDRLTMLLYNQEQRDKREREKPKLTHLKISVREANELRFALSREFINQRFEALHEMLRRIDRVLTEAGVEPLKSKFDAGKE